MEEVSLSEKNRVVQRLRREREERQGEHYQAGFLEGERWAKELAAWSEVYKYAQFTSNEVQLEGSMRGFNGPFCPPEEDYWSAPWVKVPHEVFDEMEDLVHNKYEAERYWRGWLAGVRSVYDLVKDELGEPPVTTTDIPF